MRIFFVLMLLLSPAVFANPVQIFVIGLNKQIYTVTITRDTTVADLKSVVYEKTGIEPQTQRLSTGIKDLHEGLLMSEHYNIGRHSNVFLSLRLRGGNYDDRVLMSLEQVLKRFSKRCRQAQ